MKAMSEIQVHSPQPAENLERALPTGAETPDAAARAPLARHWKTLGIPPTDDLQQLDTSFYLMVEEFSSNPTEEEELRRAEMHRAFAVLRRSLTARGPARAAPVDWGGLATRRTKIAAGVVAAIALAGLLWFNFGTLKLRWVRHEPGTVLRLANAEAPYGTVVGFDPAHRFRVGAPTGAYELRLADDGRSIWLAERVVEKGMVRAR